MILDTDVWRIGIAQASAARLIEPGGLAAAEIAWLAPGDPFTYLADPFGLWRGGVLHVFAEAYDYRTRHGVIDVLRLDADLRIIDRRTCLAEPWHLSYPFVFEAEGATWLLPEAHKSGTLTLYRAEDFPMRWTPAARLPLDAPAIDATPFRHDGRWWLAYAPGGDIAARQGRLHLAFADRLAGPWRPHPGNPVRIDRGGSRPAGAAIVAGGGELILPVQDCAAGYGAAVRPLRIETLTPDRFAASLGAALRPPPEWLWRDGFHTIAQCGAVTLIDAKRIDRSWGGRSIDLRRIARGLVPRLPSPRHRL